MPYMSLQRQSMGRVGDTPDFHSLLNEADISLTCPPGRYELIAVLTHKGRSADSGHYVSWGKQDDNSWIQFDDEEMVSRKEEEIVELSGGGDWHMAYLLLYKAIRVTAE